MSGDPPRSLADVLAERALGLASERFLHRATAEALAPDGLEDLDPHELEVGLAYARSLMWQRTVPARFLWARLEDFAGEVRHQLSDWSQDPQGRNLLLLGPVGSGKTHAAVAAVRDRYHTHGAEVRFLPVVELLDLLRPGGPEGALYDLADVELLIVDDLASERSTDWTAERLYALVNRRWLEERPTICTTNLNPPDLEAEVGARVYSRLVGSGAVGVRLSGPDRRREART